MSLSPGAIIPFITTLSAPTPVIPNLNVTNLRDISRTQNSITWDWNTTSAATSYQYAVRTSGGTYSSTSNITASTVTVTELQPNTTYEIRVRARRSPYFGSYVFDTATTNTPDPEPEAPDLTITNLRDISRTQNSITWDWNTTSAATSYQYAIRTSDGNWSDTRTLTNSVVGRGGLESDTTYEIRVRARTSEHFGDYVYDTATTNTPDPEPEPEAPDLTITNLRTTHRTNTEIEWDWNTTSAATSYQSAIRISGGTYGSTINRTASRIRRHGLDPDTEYEIRVRARTSSHFGDYVTHTATTHSS